MKKILIILCLLFLTGCSQYNELNSLAIIKSIGITKENNYILYAEIIEEIDKDNNPQTRIIEATGKTIDEIFTNIKILVNKEIYLSHIDLIILHEKLKNEDLQNIINYFLSHKEFRNNFLVLISEDIQTVLEKAKYDEIEKLVITNKESKQIIKISFEEVMQKFLDKEPFYLSKISYQKQIQFDGNIKYQNKKIERIYDEKEN